MAMDIGPLIKHNLTEMLYIYIYIYIYIYKLYVSCLRDSFVLDHSAKMTCSFVLES